MKLREDYPIYLNPTDDELIELGKSHWDTLRVMESDDTLIISSGHGNTHETLVQYYKRYSGNGKTKERWNCRTQSNETVYVGKTPDWTPFIFFRKYGIMYCNLGDAGGPDSAKPERWKRCFLDNRNKQFEFLAQISELEAF